MFPSAFPPILWVVAALGAWLAMITVGVYFVARALMRSGGGGWAELTDRYPTSLPPCGERVFNGESVQVGAVLARNCATVGVGPGGLYLKAPWRRAALIPWQDVATVEAVTLFWRPAYRLAVGRPRLAWVTVTAPLFGAIGPWLPPRVILPVKSPERELAGASH